MQRAPYKQTEFMTQYLQMTDCYLIKHQNIENIESK